MTYPSEQIQLLRLPPASADFLQAVRLDQKRMMTTRTLGPLWSMRGVYSTPWVVTRKRCPTSSGPWCKPGDPGIRFSLGVTYLSLERHDEAREQLQQALTEVGDTSDNLNHQIEAALESLSG